MSWTRRWTPALTRASLAAGSAAVGASWQLWRALSVTPLPAPAPPGPVEPIPAVALRAPTPPAARQTAVGANPFRPERAPPAVAFRMPADHEAAPEFAPQARPGLVLIGTAVLPGDRGFALCQVGGEAPRLVRLGEQVGGYTLKTVAQGSATFLAANGTSMDVTVPKAGSLRAN